MKKSTATKKVLFLTVFAIALSLAFLPVMANANAFTDFPIAVDGRILSVDQTGDTANWVEVAKYGEYSLIVRQQFLNRSISLGWNDPQKQYIHFGSTPDYNASWVRIMVNDWFNARTTIGIVGLDNDRLSLNARLRNYTVQHNAIFKMGTSCRDISLTDGLSIPTHYQVGIGNDIAFVLSYGEAVGYLSLSRFTRDSLIHNVYSSTPASSWIARSNYDKLTIPPATRANNVGMWLRSPGDTKNHVAATIFGPGWDGMVTESTLAFPGIVVYPALWVGSGIFESSATINVVCRDIMDQSVLKSDSYRVASGAYGPYNPPAISGYTYVGPSGDSAPVSGTIQEGQTRTITFLYMKSGATVTYMPNGGTGANRSYDVNIGGTHTVFDQGYTRANYTFTGWNTVSDGSGISYSNGQTISITGNVTLYAQWSIAQSHMLIYSPNGGVGNIVVDMTDNAGRITIQNQNYFRDAHIFTGWNTMPNGTGISYLTGQTITLNSTLILYAQWERTTDFYSITYLPGTGGVGGSIDTGLAAGWRYNIKNPMAAGVNKPWSVFDKWNTEIDGSGISYVPGQAINVFGNLTLYAIWYDQG